jgi:D-alanine transaminase
MSQKLKLITYEDERYLYCNIKTLNLLPNVLASQKAAEAGCNEAVFHRGDIVTECAHSNISILKGGVLRTAPLTKYILPGTVRKQMLELARENDIPIDETAFTLSELLNADEVIVTSTTLMIHGTESIDGKAVGGKDAATLGLLQDAYMRRVDRELK